MRHYRQKADAILALERRYLAEAVQRRPISSEAPVETSGSDIVPIGGEFQVNTYTPRDQLSPVVAGLTGGGYVVVWESLVEDAGATRRVAGQIYDATGAPVGGEFHFDPRPDIDQAVPIVEALEGGGFVVICVGAGRISSRIYDESGRPEGLEEILTSARVGQLHAVALESGGVTLIWSTAGGQGSQVLAVNLDAAGVPGAVTELDAIPTQDVTPFPSVAALNGGGYAAVWTAYEIGAPNQWVLHGRTSNGSTFEVDRGHVFGSVSQVTRVVALSEGDFAVIWARRADWSGPINIYGQVFGPDGSGISGQFPVNISGLDDLSEVEAVSLADGRFAVAWMGRSDELEDSTSYLSVRLFESSGAPVSLPSRVNAPGTTVQHSSIQAEALEDGGFVLTWAGSDSGSMDVFGRVYDDYGDAFGSQFRVNTHLDGTQGWMRMNGIYRPGGAPIAPLADGGFVVAWESEWQDTDGYGIFGQRYGAPISSDVVREGTDSDRSLPVNGHVDGRINSEGMDGSDPGTDKDWYRVSLVAGHTYVFEATADVRAADRLNSVSIRLFAGENQAASPVADGASPRIVFTAPATGDYWISIGAGGGGLGPGQVGDYRIDLRESAPPPLAGADDFADSQADISALIGRLEVGVVQQGVIGLADGDTAGEGLGDKDVFAINLVAGEYYEFRLASTVVGGSALRSGAFTIRDDNFDVLRTSGSGEVVVLGFSATRTASYFVRVASGGAPTETGGYELTVIGPAAPRAARRLRGFCGGRRRWRRARAWRSDRQRRGRNVRGRRLFHSRA